MSTPFDVLATRLDAVSRQLRAQASDLVDASAAVEALAGRLAAVTDRLSEVEDLAATTASMVADQAESDGQPRQRALVSWLAEPDPDVFLALVIWVGSVLVQYPGVVDALGECWPYHPWIVEELSALHAAWAEAYTGQHPSGIRAVDWHDRHRPGVIERIRQTLTDCSLHAHAPGGRADHAQLPEVPGLEQARTAVAWWTSQRPTDSADGAGGER